MEISPALPPPARLPRYSRAENYPPIKIGRPKRLILEAIAQFHYLSGPQLTRLLFSPGSLTYCLDHCKELFHSGHLRRVFLPKATPLGSSVAINTLDSKGYRFLRQVGIAPEGRFRPSEQHREQLYLEHTLAANDFLILCHQLARHSARISIERMLTERRMRRHPIKARDVASEKGEKIYVVPDGWINLVVDSTYQFPLAIELDRGSVQRLSFQRKVRGLVEFNRGEYQKVFGTDCLTILCLVARGGDKRLRDIIRWTEEELKKIGAQASADLFRFAQFDPAIADPRQVFYSRLWNRPFDTAPLSLLGP